MKKKTIYIRNTHSGIKEPFVPVLEGKVGMYVCGPTVYGAPHLGHARSAITFDVVYRFFRFLGYQVRYVRNITDVGHLEDELNEQGEDKIVKRARLEQLEPMEIAQHNTNLYRDLMAKINVSPPSIEPLATGHIMEQIAIVEQILDNGLAYVVNGSVYFDIHAYIQKYPYGELSGRVQEELQSGSRMLDGQVEKKHPGDFALWKKAHEQHVMQWKSPWGMGFPGWHIECTAMSNKYLGLPFDIHGGGMDLKFPHHEAEIAQSFAAFGVAPVNYWMHNNMMTLDGQKMAKSKGNFITLSQMFSGEHPLLEKAYSPMTVRFLMLQAHYSSPIDFSNRALQAAEVACKKLVSGLDLITSYSNRSKYEEIDGSLSKRVIDVCESCYLKMCDDFNTAETIACLFDLYNVLQKINDAGYSISDDSFLMLKETYIGFLHDVLGIVPEVDKKEGGVFEGVMAILLDIRQQARQDKNFVLSDKIRDQLAALGLEVRDGDSQIMYQVKR